MLTAMPRRRTARSTLLRLLSQSHRNRTQTQ